MATGVNPATVREGLVFHYDMGNEKSFIGAPTVNYMNVWHPRKDSSYTPYVANTLPYLWQNNHPNAIYVNSFMTGGDITGFVNSGVGDWGNTFHAIWTYDPLIGEPVITMNDYDGGNWKAFNGNHALNLAALGLTTGDYYTYSYDQWVSNTSIRVNPGMYTMNATSVTAFWDGQGGSQETAINTKAGEWQRRWCTFQISASHDVNKAYTRFYWYGYYYTHNEIVKIRRPQLELGKNYASAFTLAPRTDSNSLIDITGHHSINVANCAFANNQVFSFTGSAGANGIFVDISPSYYPVSNAIPRSWEVVAYPTAAHTTAGIFGNQAGAGCSYMCNGGVAIYSGNYAASWYDNTSYQWLSSSVAATNGAYAHIIVTYDASDFKLRIYVNGTLRATSSATNMSYNSNQVLFIIGFLGANGLPFTGQIPIAKYYYGKCLNANEVARNFNAVRGRFGL